MPKQVFLAHFEPVVTRFGPWKIPKCLEMRLLWEQQWEKNGSNTRLVKSDLEAMGVHKHISPFHHIYAPSCTLRTYLRAVWWSHVGLALGV